MRYNLGIQIRNMKIDFKTGGTWLLVGQWIPIPTYGPTKCQVTPVLKSIYIFRSWDTYRYIHIILVSFIFSDLILFFYYCVVLLAISQKKWRRGSPNFATVVESFTALMECKRMDPGYKVIIINSFLHIVKIL